MCEAFQLTAATQADDVALRTLGDAVSIYNTSSEEQIAYLLQDAACAVVIVEAAFAPRIAAAAAQTGTVRHTILIDDEDDDALGLDALEARGAEASDFDFEATWRSVAGDDLPP